MKNVEFLLKKGFDLKEMNTNYDGVHSGYTIYCGAHIRRYERRNDDDTRIDALLRWMDEEHKINILDDAEKKYLSAVIKPFRNDVLYIRKGTITENSSMERITIITRNGGNLYFPGFKRDTMYKGMESTVAYKLEELGL